MDEREESVSLSSRSESGEEGVTINAKERKRLALFAPISSLASALGGFEEFRNKSGGIVIEYSLGDQVVGCLKDLKRFWKLDDNDDDRTVARIFFQIGLLKNDLIPIILSTIGTGAKGDRIALACAELIAAMTWPIDVATELQEAKLNDDLEKSLDYTSLLQAHRVYKALIIHMNVLPALLSLMAPSLQKTRRDRVEKDENIISLILHVFRNLAAVRDKKEGNSVSADDIEASALQSEYIFQLSETHIFELLLAIASNAETTEFGPWNMLALDIFHLLFRCVSVEELIVPPAVREASQLGNLLENEAKIERAAARNATSRHSRFGTTFAVQSGSSRYIVHKQSAATKGGVAEKIMDGVKKSKAKRIKLADNLNLESKLQSSALKVMLSVAITFIDTCFNPFFSSILKDIRMERLKVKQADTVRFLFLSRFFLEFFLTRYNDQIKRGITYIVEEGQENETGREEKLDFGLIAILTEVASIGFITARMKMAMEEKPQLWTELHAATDAFTQILLVIDELMLSGIETNIEVAELLQNKLYYEGETMEMVLRVVVSYKKQSLRYLDSIMHLTYVLLRMLEKYSQSKSYMFVRKKKHNVGKKKKTNLNGEQDEGDGIGEEDEDQEVIAGSLSYKEHAFEFAKFESHFADESVLESCMIYLEGWKEFKPDQLKRIVSLMHRMAVKAKSDGLFFRPTVLELFRRILDDDDMKVTRPKMKEYGDLKNLIEFVLKKFFKAVEKSPFLIVEIFLPKTRSQLSRMRLGEEDPWISDDDEVHWSKSLLTGDIEVQAGFSHTQQIGIVMTCLIEDERMNLIDLIKAQLSKALEARKEIVKSIDGEIDMVTEEDLLDDDEALRKKALRLQGPSNEAIELFTDYNVEFEFNSDRKAAGHNSQFKLLMSLFNWEPTAIPDSDDIAWSIPSTILPSTLSGDLNIIEGFLLDPLDRDTGSKAADLLKKKRKPSSRVKKIAEPKVPRERKKKEEQTSFKSAQFIIDSDNDEEADRLFFEREEALRLSNDAAGNVLPSREKKSKKNKKLQKVKKSAAKPNPAMDFVVNSSDLEDGMDEVLNKKRPKKSKKSPVVNNSPPSPTPPGSSQVSATVPAEESEEEVTTIKRKRVIEDSDEE